MMDICCGLGTVSLAGRALTNAVKAAAPDDKRGIEVSTSCAGLLCIAIRAAKVPLFCSQSHSLPQS